MCAVEDPAPVHVSMLEVEIRRQPVVLPRLSFTVQRLDLQRNAGDTDNDAVRGQIVISLISRDRGGSGPMVADATGIPSSIPYDPNELPEG